MKISASIKYHRRAISATGLPVLNSLLFLGFIFLHSLSHAAGELVFYNGAIYTVNADMPWVSALSISDGVITALGDDETLLSRASDDAQTIDLRGRMLLPGFQDPHLHPLEASIYAELCYLSPYASASRYKREIKYCAKRQRGQSWLRAAGVSLPDLLRHSPMPIALLDSIISDRPALILDNLGHGAWVNTLALQAVGYDLVDGQLPGGLINRHPVTGRPTGILLENAQQRVRSAAFPQNEANSALLYKQLLVAMKTLNAHGITSISDAGGFWASGHHLAWQRAEREGTMTVRASNALYVYPDQPYEKQLATFKQLYRNDANSLLRYNQAKFYVDGILSQGTASLYRPYLADLPLAIPSNDGFLYFPPQLIHNYTRDLSSIGFQMHFHAVGDRATGLALNAIEAAMQEGGNGDLRHRITHLYLVAAKDRPRFHQLGVIADFQLSTTSTDKYYRDYMVDFIGRNRVNQLQPIASLLNSGARVVLSSDWDADPLSPLAKIQAVLQRKTEKIADLATIIRMMTINVAYLLHTEERTGSLEVGKLADLVVLDQNLFAVPIAKISKTRVHLTLLDGQAVYDPRGMLD